MADDEVVRKILSLNSETRRTYLPVLLLEKLQDCLAVEITETDLFGLGAESFPRQLQDAILTPISASGA